MQLYNITRVSHTCSTTKVTLAMNISRWLKTKPITLRSLWCSHAKLRNKANPTLNSGLLNTSKFQIWLSKFNIPIRFIFGWKHILSNQAVHGLPTPPKTWLIFSLTVTYIFSFVNNLRLSTVLSVSGSSACSSISRWTKAYWSWVKKWISKIANNPAFVDNQPQNIDAKETFQTKILKQANKICVKILSIIKIYFAMIEYNNSKNVFFFILWEKGLKHFLVHL